jgi:hypothetical protein
MSGAHANDPRERVKMKRDFVQVGRMKLRKRTEALPELPEKAKQREFGFRQTLRSPRLGQATILIDAPSRRKHLALSPRRLLGRLGEPVQ